MAFRVFPDQINAPMRLAAGAMSGFIAFKEMRSSATGGSMFLRLVKLGPGCQPPGGNVPKILLRAQSTSGAPPDERGKLVPEDPITAPIVNRAGLGVPPVARASFKVLPLDIYLVTVQLIGSEVSDWGIKIGNEDPVEGRFTWVVADSEEQTERPWVNLRHNLEFSVSVAPDSTASTTKTVQITNLGTGVLKLVDPPAASGLPGERFKLGPIPDPIAPNDCGQLAITFEGRASSPTGTGKLRLDSNDPRADGSPEHNAEIALTGETSVMQPIPDEPPPPEPRPCTMCDCPDLEGPLVNNKCRRCHHPELRHRLPI
jgi:hypothetical protein